MKWLETTSPEDAQRLAVTAAAWSWLRTPWRHNQALKGYGIDCGRFLIEVYREAGVIPDVDPGNYARDWNLHRSEEVYLGYVQAHAGEIAAEEAKPGDCVLYRFGLTYSHGAVVVAPSPRILHAYVRQGVVLADWNETHLLAHAPRFFSPWRR